MCEREKERRDRNMGGKEGRLLVSHGILVVCGHVYVSAFLLSPHFNLVVNKWRKL